MSALRRRSIYHHKFEFIRMIIADGIETELLLEELVGARTVEASNKENGDAYVSQAKIDRCCNRDRVKPSDNRSRRDACLGCDVPWRRGLPRRRFSWWRRRFSLRRRHVPRWRLWRRPWIRGTSIRRVWRPSVRRRIWGLRRLWRIWGLRRLWWIWVWIRLRAIGPLNRIRLSLLPVRILTTLSEAVPQVIGLRQADVRRPKRRPQLSMRYNVAAPWRRIRS